MRLVADGPEGGHTGDRNRRGLFESLSVTATDIGSGKSVVFVQRSGGPLRNWSQDPFVRAQFVTDPTRAPMT